jgi:hypothetical protein
MAQAIVQYVKKPNGDFLVVNLALYYDGFEDYRIKEGCKMLAEIKGIPYCRIFRFVLTENYGWVYYSGNVRQELWCCDDREKDDYIRLSNKSANAEGTSLNYSFGDYTGTHEIRSVVEQVYRDVPRSAFDKVPVSNLENA